MSQGEIAIKGNGFSVRNGPPVSYTDAGRQLRAIRAADALDSAVDNQGLSADQEGEGIAAKLRDLAVRIGKEALQRKLGLHHISNVAKLLGHASKHHAGVAAEDAGHAAAAADVYLPQTSAQRTATIEAYRRQRLQCIADMRTAAGISLPFEAAPATTTPRRTATWPSAGSGAQPGTSAPPPTPESCRRCWETTV